MRLWGQGRPPPGRASGKRCERSRRWERDLPTTNEWLGFIVVIFLAGALVSRLLWAGGRHQGMPTRQLRRTLAVVWVAMVACAAGLVVVRVCLGGDIIDYDAHAENPLVTRRLAPGETLLVGMGMGWMALWMVVALRAVRKITAGLTDTVRDASDGQD